MSSPTEPLSISDEGCSDTLLLHSFRPNRDGTVTVWGAVILYSPDGEPFENNIKVRLRACNAEAQAYAKRRYLEVSHE